MKKQLANLFIAAGILTVWSFSASAQTNDLAATVVVTNVITMTNTVIVLETNVVTVTNAIAPAPAPVVAAPPAKSAWESSIAAGLTLTRGNSDTLLFTAGILTEKKGEHNEWSFGASASYGENNGVENINAARGFGQVNHLFSEKFYGYVRVNALHDAIADVEYRVTVGPGVGYYLLKETNTTFAVEAGVAAVFEKLGTNDNIYATLRLAERFEHKFNSWARIWEGVEILPQVDDFANYMVNGEIGVESALTKTFSLQVILIDNYNSQPAAGREKNDIKLVSGVKYTF